MADKYPSLGNYTISSELIDDHEWITDSFIDDLGKNCLLYYPPSNTECDNCILDAGTGRSSGIYKSGGPISFPNHGVCPRCGGYGRLTLQTTATIKLRIYWNPKDWIKLNIKFDAGDSVCMSIGYLTDLPKMEMAERILINSDIETIKRFFCERMGEAVPHGFRHNRYFIQYLKRLGGG